MKNYYVREIEPADNGAYQYGVFEYECVPEKPHIQMSRATLIKTFDYEWRAIRFMNERRRSNEDIEKT